jgi:dUTP pyrophosphatase
MELPCNTYGRIADRSSLALYHGIHCLGGVIDCDYRGVVHIILRNLSDQEYQIRVGDRVAQLIVERISYPVIDNVGVIDFNTERGDLKFGSSGV